MTHFIGHRNLGLRGGTAGFHGSASPITGSYRASRVPNIFMQRGAFTAPFRADAARYARGGPWGGARTGTVSNVVVPKGARSLRFLEPQSITSGRTFDRGRALAQSLGEGKYPRSAAANALRQAFAQGGNPALSRSAALRRLPVNPATLGLLAAAYPTDGIRFLPFGGEGQPSVSHDIPDTSFGPVEGIKVIKKKKKKKKKAGPR
jgi:hypothetical protein